MQWLISHTKHYLLTNECLYGNVNLLRHSGQCLTLTLKETHYFQFTNLTWINCMSVENTWKLWVSTFIWNVSRGLLNRQFIQCRGKDSVSAASVFCGILLVASRILRQLKHFYHSHEYLRGYNLIWAHPAVALWLCNHVEALDLNPVFGAIFYFVCVLSSYLVFAQLQDNFVVFMTV